MPQLLFGDAGLGDVFDGRKHALTICGDDAREAEPAPDLVAVAVQIAPVQPDEALGVIPDLLRQRFGAGALFRVGEIDDMAPEELFCGPSHEVAVGAVDPDVRAVRSEQCLADRRLVEHAAEEHFAVAHRLVHTGVFEGEGRVHGERFEQRAALLTRQHAVDRVVDAEDAEQLAVGSQHRREQRVEGMPEPIQVVVGHGERWHEDLHAVRLVRTLCAVRHEPQIAPRG